MTPSTRPVTVRDERGELVPGEAVVRLRPGARIPENVGGLSCRVVTAASPTIVLVQCEPVGREPADTDRLIEALLELEGVVGAERNHVRHKRGRLDDKR